MAEDYSCGTIQVLSGLEAVRRRPGMYIGGTESVGLHNMLMEVIDWAVDEHVEASATYVRVVHVGNAIVVEHDGEGLSTEPHPANNGRTIEAQFTLLHRHRHRLGPAVATALSTEMQVTSSFEGRAYRQAYVRGEAHGPPEDVGPTDRTGVRIRFVPDEAIFGGSRFSRVMIRRALRLRAACHPRLTLLHDERAYRAPDGVADLVRHLARGAPWQHEAPIHLRAEVEGIAVDAALLWTARRERRQVALVGDQRCPYGSHVVGLVRGIQDGFGIARPSLRDVYPTAFGEVMSPGLVWALRVDMLDPCIQGQGRERLNDPDAGRLVRTLVSRGLAARLGTDAELRAALFARLPRGV